MMNLRLFLRLYILGVFVKQTVCAPMIKTDRMTPGTDDVTVENPVEETPYKGITDTEGATVRTA